MTRSTWLFLSNFFNAPKSLSTFWHEKKKEINNFKNEKWKCYNCHFINLAENIEKSAKYVFDCNNCGKRNMVKIEVYSIHEFPKEGMIKKGGLNKNPMSLRPSEPPKAQSLDRKLPVYYQCIRNKLECPKCKIEIAWPNSFYSVDDDNFSTCPSCKTVYGIELYITNYGKEEEDR